MTAPPPPPPPVTKHFALEDANRTLPLVRMIVRDVVELFPDVQRRRERLVDIQAESSARPVREDDPYAEEVRQMQDELEADEDRLQGCFDELTAIGAELKDPIAGLVDFPTLVDGGEACLCWKLGEEEIDFWHAHDSGFAGRRPLDDATSIGPAVCIEEDLGIEEDLDGVI